MTRKVFKKFMSGVSFLQIFSKISFLYSTSLRFFSVGFVFSPFVLTMFLVFQLAFKEYSVSSASMVSSICLGVIMTELLLFVSFFWGVFTSILSPSYISDSSMYTPTEGLVCLDSRELILPITSLLATASVLVTYVFMACEKGVASPGLKAFCFSVIIAYLFTSMQVCEYIGTSIYINDANLGTYFFIITGLHFSHVLVGAVLLLYMFWKGTVDIDIDLRFQGELSTGRATLPTLESIFVLYWHFVELIWLVVFAIFYTL